MWINLCLERRFPGAGYPAGSQLDNTADRIKPIFLILKIINDPGMDLWM